MNTTQLVILWYAGIVISLICFNEASGYGGNASYAIGGIVMLAGLLLYTLKPHPNAKKSWVLFWIFGPIIAISVFGLLLVFVRS